MYSCLRSITFLYTFAVIRDTIYKSLQKLFIVTFYSSCKYTINVHTNKHFFSKNCEIRMKNSGAFRLLWSFLEMPRILRLLHWYGVRKFEENIFFNERVKVYLFFFDISR